MSRRDHDAAARAVERFRAQVMECCRPSPPRIPPGGTMADRAVDEAYEAGFRAGVKATMDLVGAWKLRS